MHISMYDLHICELCELKVEAKNFKFADLKKIMGSFLIVCVSSEKGHIFGAIDDVKHWLYRFFVACFIMSLM